MHNKLKVTIVLLLSLTFIFIATQTFEGNSTNLKELTLIEAYKLSFEEAKKWNNKSKLYFMTSTDTSKEPRGTYDSKGKRKDWNTMYVVPETNKWLIIEIRDGQVSNTKDFNQFTPPNNKIIDFTDIQIDSSQALKKAKDYFNLKPGKNWAKGYHFVLNKQNSNLILTVVGVDDNGYFTKVIFDAGTGEIMSAIHKVPSGGGFYESKSQSTLIGGYKPYAILGSNISPNFTSDQSIIIWGYSEPSSINSLPIVKTTTDGGGEWKDIYITKNIKDIFFSDTYKEDNTIFFVSENTILKSNTSTNRLENFFEADNLIIDVDKHEKSFYILTENALLISYDDGNEWITFNIPKNSKSINIGPNNEIFIFNSEEIYKKDASNWTKVINPLKNNILGLEISNNTLVAYSDNEVGIFNINSKTWKIINDYQLIKKVIFDYDFESNHQIYILSNDGSINVLGGGVNGWKGRKLSDRVEEGEIVSISSGPNNKLFICKTPDIIWQKKKGGNN